MTDAYALSFATSRTLAEMLAQFNNLGPWEWINRDNDSWGAYISARVLGEPHWGMVKVIPEHDKFALNVTLRSDARKARKLFDEVRVRLVEQFLPAIDARAITDTQHYD